MIKRIAIWNIAVLVELLLICGGFLTLSFSRQKSDKDMVLIYISILLIAVTIAAGNSLLRSTYKILALDFLDLKLQKNGAVVSLIIGFMLLAVWIFKTFVFNDGIIESSWMDLVFLVPVFTIAYMVQLTFAFKLPQAK